MGELNRSPFFLPISPDSSPESLSKKTRNYKEEIEKYKLICARNRVINGHATGEKPDGKGVNGLDWGL